MRFSEKTKMLYATDLKEEIRTDAFMGEGFEEAFKKSQQEGYNLVVGEYFKKWRVEE